MKVLVHTDIEGVAGVVTFGEQTRPGGSCYERGKGLLTAEVNAAVQGLLDEGVTEILVNDGHGPGAIAFEELHPAARLLHGRPKPPLAVRREVFGRYDVAVMVGQHAMAAVERGTLNHTQSSDTVDCYRLNGRLIGEIAQAALFAGALGLPLIFLSGDDAACREAADLITGITTVAVKEGLGRQSAISLSQQAAHQAIGQGIRQAVRRHRAEPVAPLAWTPPFELEKRYLFTEGADAAMADPRAERVDSRTVRIRGNDILALIYA